MGKRPKRKVVLVLVEGKSDIEALELAFTELYESIDEEIELFFPLRKNINEADGGDITSQISVWPKNIEEKMYDYFLREFFDIHNLYPKDISEIIQIVDIDGAYIDDSNICDGEDRIYYGEDSIYTNRVNAIIKRNLQKRTNIDYLVSLEKIKIKQKSIPYAIYYFSTNLDHVLHNVRNLESSEKINLAGIFSSNHKGNVEAFIHYFDKVNNKKGMTYSESWDFIKQENNSLKRYTNINILFNKLMHNK